MLKDNTNLTTAQLKDWEPVIRDCYELVYEEIFPRTDDAPNYN